MTIRNLEPKFVRSYPHAAKGFCQGLTYDPSCNRIIESVGIRGESGLLWYALGYSDSVKFAEIDPIYFGEGITILGDTLYHGTLDGIVFVRKFNGSNFIGNCPIVSAFIFPSEVWGLGTDGKELLVTNGTETLFCVNISNYEVEAVYSFGYHGLNDFTLYNGFYIFNVYGMRQLLVVDVESKEVAATIDCSRLIPLDRNPEEVMNGVTAYGNNLLITGKRWPEIFEIEIPCL
jgi:glutamine cyclotransferase